MQLVDRKDTASRELTHLTLRTASQQTSRSTREKSIYALKELAKFEKTAAIPKEEEEEEERAKTFMDAL